MDASTVVDIYMSFQNILCVIYPTHTPYSTLPSLLHKPSLTFVLVRFTIAETIRSWTQAYPVNYSASPQR